MKGDAGVIQRLNKILYNELTAINQYFLHGKMLKDWGLDKLGDKEVEESIDEMKHADKLTERILFLEGIPNYQDLGKLNIGETVTEMLESDLAMEHRAHIDLIDAVKYCEEVEDFASRELCVNILESEEEHIDWLETQLNLIKLMGEQNYCQTMAGDQGE